MTAGYHGATLNFAVGPVPSSDAVRAIGALDSPYFRTPEFSQAMLENERMLCGLANAPEGSRAIFPTCSGTGAMEAAVMGLLDPAADKALVVDGGSFGHRFRAMLELHGVPNVAVELEPGAPLTRADLGAVDAEGCTAFLVNLGETSQGVLYDVGLIGGFCRERGLFLVVDGISSFLADPFDMEGMGVDVLITDAQKALACPPGVAPMALSPRAVERASSLPQPCMYLDLRDMLGNQGRGQTPFTPAVTTLLQIRERLSAIGAGGGAAAEVARCAAVAGDFRERLAASGLPLGMRLASPSNAVTYVESPEVSARALFAMLKDEYGIWLCPNGGERADSSFRVGHIGEHPLSDNALLVAALADACARLSAEPGEGA